jgi:protein HIRA/HIR1
MFALRQGLICSFQELRSLTTYYILDHFVRLWSLKTVCEDAAFQNEDVHNELFAGKRHDGAVMCVRWSSKTGTLLASASDDGSMIIWQLEKYV